MNEIGAITLSNTAIIALLLGCAHSRTTTNPEQAGYVVIGARWATMLRSNNGDTLAELHARDVSSAVQTAAKSVAERGSLGLATCNRFFRANNRLLVLFASFCGRNWGGEYDSRVFGVFETDGRLVQVFRSWGKDEIAKIEPYMRLTKN